jgi:uracil-DNA glycosylase family 4
VSLQRVQDEIVQCARCPRLREYALAIARTRRRAYRQQEYWGLPVPSFGDPSARLLIIGLAPGAHGANRTGRMFTGDRSGDFLYRALYDAGFANQPTSQHRDDGLLLRDAYIAAPVHCAPPDNKPTPAEVRTCSAYLCREMELLTRVRVVVVLGRIALASYLALRGLRKSAYPFAHGALYPGEPSLLCSFHPSRQNTQTGRLTQQMLTAIFLRARQILDGGPTSSVLLSPSPSSPRS